MLKLGVNIDHVATLREARYRQCERGEPDVIEAAKVCEAAGAHGITVHLREDRRHIQDRDVWKLREVVKTRLNLEMANAPEIVSIALKLKPEIVCLVPERRQEVTTEGGLDAAGNVRALTETRKKMTDAGIETSLFIAPDPAQIEAASKIGAQFVELHTGSFAESFSESPIANKQSSISEGQSQTAGGASSTGSKPSAIGDRRSAIELERLISAAKLAHSLGIQVNAGHGLNYKNLQTLHRVPHLVELNIGHSIVSRSVFVGLSAAVKEMLALMKNYRG